jgi:hypothetical protein
LVRGANVLIASAPQPDHLRRSFYPRDREVLTEHALEVSYFFEVLRDHFYEEALTDYCSEIEFFGRLASAADACLLEQPDATAHLVCAAVLREAYAMAKQIDKGEFDFLIVAEESDRTSKGAERYECISPGDKLGREYCLLWA